MATLPHSPITAIQRDDPSLGPAQLVADYEAGPELLRAAVAGLTSAELRLRPVAGRWSTLEVVCHVSDSEQFFADRLKRTLALDRPLLVAADPQTYPDAVRYQGRDLDEELALVTLTRRQVARILKLAPDEAWQRTAVHTEGGLVTLRQLVLHATRHLKHHVRFIEEKRQALAAGYRALGFRGIPASCDNPVPGTLFLELRLGLTMREEKPEDREAIREVNRQAFGREDEARLVDALRAGGYVRLSLVAEEERQVVGHILFSDLPIVTQAGTVNALALAPLAVLPARQRQGIGSCLVREGLRACAEAGHRIVVVVGHPAYYPRFGFSAHLAEGLKSPFSGPAFMALELVPGALEHVTGKLCYPPPFGLEASLT
jgi:putative acetyltransferase